MYALTISTDADVEGSTEGPDDGDEEEEELTLQAMTEPAVENIESEKHQTSQRVKGSFQYGARKQHYYQWESGVSLCTFC